MIEFVGLPPPNLENQIRGCHGNHAFSRCPSQISFKENFVSHSEGPTWIKKALGVQDRSYLNPSPRLIFIYVIFPYFLNFHAFSWIYKWDNNHIGPLDEWTCQIVALIILKHATIAILIWNQPIYICNDFPLFFAFLLIFINMHIMQIWYVAYLTTE